jgi:hypothetical protein
VGGSVEEVGVGVEGDAGAGVAEDAADLGDIEPQVDDQVAGEGVAQIVEAQRRRALAVDPGSLGGAGECASLDVSMSERGAAAGREDVVARGTETGACRCRASRSASCGASGISRTAAAVFGGTLSAGLSAFARESWQRTWIRPAAKSMSAQLRPSSSESRTPV